MDIERIISVVVGLVSLSTIIFYAGYNFRTVGMLRKTVHELNAWKQNLLNDLEVRFVRKDIFEEKLTNIDEKLDEIKNNMERRGRPRE